MNEWKNEWMKEWMKERVHNVYSLIAFYALFWEWFKKLNDGLIIIINWIFNVTRELYNNAWWIVFSNENFSN